MKEGKKRAREIKDAVANSQVASRKLRVRNESPICKSPSEIHVVGVRKVKARRTRKHIMKHGTNTDNGWGMQTIYNCCCAGYSGVRGAHKSVQLVRQ